MLSSNRLKGKERAGWAAGREGKVSGRLRKAGEWLLFCGYMHLIEPHSFTNWNYN